MLKILTTSQEMEDVLGPGTLDRLALRGAQMMLHQALEEEVVGYFARHQERDAQGHALVVPNGKARARKVTCGAGTLTVEAPRVNDRRVDAQGSDSASRVGSCPRICGARPRSRRCCRCCTCAASRRATFARRCPSCSAKMPQACRPPTSRG